MCRAGGRRCPGQSARATETARKARYRAAQKLRAARAGGDPEVIAAAKRDLDQAVEHLAQARAHRAASDNATDAFEGSADGQVGEAVVVGNRPQGPRLPSIAWPPSSELVRLRLASRQPRL